MKKLSQGQLEKRILSFNNEANLNNAIQQIVEYLQGWIRN
jgi:hypothetical protein